MLCLGCGESHSISQICSGNQCRVTTLNAGHRKQQLQKIAEENQELLKRIQAVRFLLFCEDMLSSTLGFY